VGGNVGEVSRIGIRASVIRTADGSEVILPNGSLISSQVTNPKNGNGFWIPRLFRNGLESFSIR